MLNPKTQNPKIQIPIISTIRKGVSGLRQGDYLPSKPALQKDDDKEVSSQPRTPYTLPSGPPIEDEFSEGGSIWQQPFESYGISPSSIPPITKKEPEDEDLAGIMEQRRKDKLYTTPTGEVSETAAQKIQKSGDASATAPVTKAAAKTKRRFIFRNPFHTIREWLQNHKKPKLNRKTIIDSANRLLGILRQGTDAVLLSGFLGAKLVEVQAIAKRRGEKPKLVDITTQPTNESPLYGVQYNIQESTGSTSIVRHAGPNCKVSTVSPASMTVAINSFKMAGFIGDQKDQNKLINISSLEKSKSSIEGLSGEALGWLMITEKGFTPCDAKSNPISEKEFKELFQPTLDQLNKSKNPQEAKDKFITQINTAIGPQSAAKVRSLLTPVPSVAPKP